MAINLAIGPHDSTRLLIKFHALLSRGCLSWLALTRIDLVSSGLRCKVSFSPRKSAAVYTYIALKRFPDPLSVLSIATIMLAQEYPRLRYTRYVSDIINCRVESISDINTLMRKPHEGNNMRVHGNLCRLSYILSFLARRDSLINLFERENSLKYDLLEF